MRSRDTIVVRRLPDRIEIDAPRYRAAVRTRGYVSGIAGGSFLDKATGARDLGFGLDIVDFLLEPADPAAPVPNGQYPFGKDEPNHGAIPKRYVEGPQICTQAKALEPSVHVGPDFVAIRQGYTWDVAYAPREKAGSTWEQTLIFPASGRHILASDRVTVANASPELFLRIDLPGHIKHTGGMGFDHVYLSYDRDGMIPSTEFLADVPPEARWLYRRGQTPRPDRFIRAYQVDLGPGTQGPWLAGMTLNPDDVYQAWCHQRGYVCLIQEIGGRAVKPGDHFGAAYVLGWFKDLDAMEATYDRHRGASGWRLEGPEDRPTGYRALA